MGLYLTETELLKHLEKIKKEKKKIVFTNGCFDILHVGHIRYLQEAKNLGDFLIVALNTDESIKKIKGPHRPIQKEADRAEILSALACVDFTLLFEEDTPIRIIKKIQPDILVKGGDWAPSKIVGADFVQSYGGDVKSLKFIEGRSTSQIINDSQISKKK